MAGTDIKATSHKVFPEMIWKTNGQNLAEGDGYLFKIDSIPPNQLIVPLSYSVESVASIKSQLFIDQQAVTNEIPNDVLGGLGKNNNSHPEHEIGYSFKEFKYGINNSSGGVSNDHRSRILYLADAAYTARKIIEKVRISKYNINPLEDPTPIAELIRKENKETLNKRDIDAISILWQERKINVLDRILNGSNVPPLFSDFLKVHEVVGTYENGIKAALTTTYAGTSIIDYDVPEGLVVTLEGIKQDVGAQATVGEKVISISRDNDKDYIEYDPACMEGAQINMPWHIHAFKNLNVRIKDTASTADVKLWAGLTIRTPGAAFKAKMEEFSPGVLPSNLEPSESEERLIESLRLRELARVGITAIG